MTNTYPQYDEVHVISDLHMGGVEADFQILKQTTRLANFIRWVSEQSPSANVALVLNGDVIDTLAENTNNYVAVDNAVEVVEGIINREPFKQIWDALAEFVHKANRSLIIVIGNHDIEMAFPQVQNFVVSRLSAGNLEARARIEFSTMGAGYICQVGDANVFCTHGNEVDPWNFLRYEDLSKAARRLNSSRSLDPKDWEPNAGTKMVKDVMNLVKRKYKWIDLLKPEAQAAVGVLLVLDPAQADKIGKLMPIVGKKLTGDKQVNQRLSADGYSAAEEEPSTDVDQLLGKNVLQSMKGGIDSSTSIDDLLLGAETSFETHDTFDQPATDMLGTGQVIWDRLTGWIRGIGKDEALRRALLDWLEGDETFDRNNEDDTFKEVTASIGSSLDFVITGHTHLDRSIPLPGGRHYFNCGTWIRLLRFTSEMLKDTDSFKPYYDVLENGSMQAIDETAGWSDPLLLDQTSAVCIKIKDKRTIGELAHIGGEVDITRTVVATS